MPTDFTSTDHTLTLTVGSSDVATCTTGFVFATPAVYVAGTTTLGIYEMGGLVYLSVSQPSGGSTCLTIGTDVLDSTTDVLCTSGDSTALIGDYYGVSGGAPSADTASSWKLGMTPTESSGIYEASFLRTMGGDGS